MPDGEKWRHKNRQGIRQREMANSTQQAVEEGKWKEKWVEGKTYIDKRYIDI